VDQPGFGHILGGILTWFIVIYGGLCFLWWYLNKLTEPWEPWRKRTSKTWNQDWSYEPRPLQFIYKDLGVHGEILPPGGPCKGHFRLMAERPLRAGGVEQTWQCQICTQLHFETAKEAQLV
jgi:hypothetical protein